MSNLKKAVKQVTPDRVLYYYNIAKTLPRFVTAYRESKNIQYPQIKFFSDVETVNKIVYEGMSLSRYGDGEFKWMSGKQHYSFQDYSEELGNALNRVLCTHIDKLLIGIPLGMIDSRKCNIYARMYWKIIQYKYFTPIMKHLDLGRVYSNASITRPYIDYRDREYSRKCFENLKRIWNKRDIVIVEGEKTKLGIGNDLFNNARSIHRIICPAENAFFKLDLIIKSIEHNVPKNTMILAALGPTATILAADLCEKGYQVVDIGHVDVEYIWYLNRSILRDPVEGKFVNESGSKECSGKYDFDTVYTDSIMDVIK
jgi:glycosyltransferase family protein